MDLPPFTRRQKEAQNMGPHSLQKEAAVFPEGWDEKVHAHIGHRLGQQRGQGGTQRPPEGNQQQIQNQIDCRSGGSQVLLIPELAMRCQKILRAMPRQEKAGRQAATHRIPQAGQYAWP